MQFFFLLLFNVFLGAVLYLVISLKLERSATEFRERRFRKEMDEIIKEFNVTAERNISLLENRIRMLRRLLEKSGDIRSLDVTLDEEDASVAQGASGSAGELPASGVGENPDPAWGGLAAGGIAVGDENNGGAMIKKGLLIFFKKIIDILPTRKDTGYDYYHTGEYQALPAAGETQEDTAPAAGDVLPRGRAIIEKDMTLMIQEETVSPEETRRVLSEEEIAEIVASSDDRYKLVSVLFEGGCAVEDISRYSGIPAGEVRLVVNLNRSRDSSGA